MIYHFSDFHFLMVPTRMVSAMAESLVLSPVSQNFKSKYALLRMRHCSPKFKSELRKRYKEKVENDRFKVLSEFRHIDVQKIDDSDIEDCINLDLVGNERFPLSNILRGCNNLDLDEELLLETVLDEEFSQFETWLLHEFELLWSEDELGDVIITCPLCCSGQFEIHPHKQMVYCNKCCSSFLTRLTKSEIQNYLFEEVDRHKSQCIADPSFTSVPADETFCNLCIVCDVCSYLQIII